MNYLWYGYMASYILEIFVIGIIYQSRIRHHKRRDEAILFYVFNVRPDALTNLILILKYRTPSLPIKKIQWELQPIISITTVLLSNNSQTNLSAWVAVLKINLINLVILSFLFSNLTYHCSSSEFGYAYSDIIAFLEKRRRHFILASLLIRTFYTYSGGCGKTRNQIIIVI